MKNEKADYRCVQGHDLCHGGTSAGPECPYCVPIIQPPHKRYSLSDLMRANLEDTVEALEAKCTVMREALEQAQSCLLGETPEDRMSDEDALADTLEKIRKALVYKCL